MSNIFGLHKPIQRRDFLQGMAFGAGLLASGCALNFGKRGGKNLRHRDASNFSISGQNDEVKTRGHSVRALNSKCFNQAKDLGEYYDLIVVGAGFSGMASALHYQELVGAKAKILILENHDSFGGHATRNTFCHEGKTYISSGGAYTLESPEDSPEQTLTMLEKVGVSFEKLSKYRTDAYQKLGLSSCLLFDSRIFPIEKVQWLPNFHCSKMQEFFSKTPLEEDEKKELVEFYTTHKNYLEGIENEESFLKKISWENFIRKNMKLGDLSVAFANLYSTDLLGLGCDAVSAYEARKIGPGFLGMDGEGFVYKKNNLIFDYETEYRFPDGLHTVARAFAKTLLPTAFPKAESLEELFLSEVDSKELENSKQNVHFRFRSMVTRIEHNSRNSVDVYYRNAEGKDFKISSKSVIMSGWGMVSKYIVPELPQEQRSSLEDYTYTPVVYINVLLRNWKAFAKIGASKMYLPHGYCTWMSLADPIHIGKYRPSYDPKEPIILSMYKYFYTPGLDVKSQVVKGRTEMESKSFQDFEKEIREELHHLFSPWGFDVSKDILGIQINRWAHGYNFFSGVSSSQSFLRGRAPLGRISFAGADAGGNPWMQSALEQGIRSAEEQSAYY